MNRRHIIWAIFTLVGCALGGWAQVSDDEFEPNDDQLQATPVLPGELEGISVEGNADFFRIRRDDPEQALLTEAFFEHAAGDIDVHIFDSRGVVLTSGISTTDNEIVYLQPGSADTLFVRVRGFLEATNTYTLRLTLLENGGRPFEDDLLEPNNSAEQATPLPTRIGSFEQLAVLENDDWFTFQAQPFDRFEANFSFIDAIGDIDVFLFDDAGTTVAKATSGSNDELLIAEFLEPRPHFLQVIGFDGDTNIYDLSWSLTQPDGPGALDFVEQVINIGPENSKRFHFTQPWAVESEAPEPVAAETTTRSVTHFKSGTKAPDFFPGELLIRWKVPPVDGAGKRSGIASRFFDDASRDEWNRLSRQYDLTSANLGSTAEERAAFSRNGITSQTHWERFSSNCRNTSEALQTCAELAKLPEIAFAEPHYFAIANQSKQTPVRGNAAVDFNIETQPHLAQVGFPAPWLESQGEGIVLAVIDSGVAASHPEFTGALWENIHEKAGQAGVDDDNNGFIDDLNGWDFVSAEAEIAFPGEDVLPRDADVTDQAGHGTAVAGVALGRFDAAAQGGDQVVGIAPQAQLMALRSAFRLADERLVLGSQDIADAIYYAVNQGADVINMSFSATTRFEIVAEAVEEARRRGVILVASAGNLGNSTVTYPAALPGVVAVGSVDLDLDRSSFSSFGSFVDLVGFGNSTLAPNLSGGYSPVNGTSFSAPQIAGAFCLALAQRMRSPEVLVQEFLHDAQSVDAENSAFFTGRLGAGFPRLDRLTTAGALLNAGQIVRVVIKNRGALPFHLSGVSGALVDSSRPLNPTLEQPLRLLPGDTQLVEVPITVTDLSTAPPNDRLLHFQTDLFPAQRSALLIDSSFAIDGTVTPEPVTWFQDFDFIREFPITVLTINSAEPAELSGADAVDLTLKTTDALGQLTWPVLQQLAPHNLSSYSIQGDASAAAADVRIRLNTATWSSATTHWNFVTGTTQRGARLRSAYQLQVVYAPDIESILGGLRSAFDIASFENRDATEFFPAMQKISNPQIQNSHFPIITRRYWRKLTKWNDLPNEGWMVTTPDFILDPTVSVSTNNNQFTATFNQTQLGGAYISGPPILITGNTQLARLRCRVRTHGLTSIADLPTIRVRHNRADFTEANLRVYEPIQTTRATDFFSRDVWLELYFIPYPQRQEDAQHYFSLDLIKNSASPGPVFSVDFDRVVLETL
jgi:subtilisin family serine protease